MGEMRKRKKEGGMGETGEKKSKGKRKEFFYTLKLNNWCHGKQHGGFEARQMNLA